MKTTFVLGLVAILSASAAQSATKSPSAATHRALVSDYCSTCHNDDLKLGNFSLQNVDLAEPERHAELLEKSF